MGGNHRDLHCGGDVLRRDAETGPLRSSGGILGAPAADERSPYWLAIQAWRRGEFEIALRHYARMVEFDRSFLPAWLGQVQMLIELNEPVQADLWAQKALGLFNGQAELLSARAVIKARQGRRAEAIDCSETAVHAVGHSAYRWLARGEVLLASKSPEAETCFERAVAEPDADGFTRLSLARVYRRYRRYGRALAAARSATEQVPDSPWAWLIRGLCERDLAVGAYRTSLEHALQLDATYAPARQALREAAGVPWLVRVFRRLRGS